MNLFFNFDHEWLWLLLLLLFFFFFQAEDGIRDTSVTGVQTCALPISVDCRNETFDPETERENTTPLLTVDPQLVSGVEGAILRNETRYTDEFLDYLNLDGLSHPKPNLPQLQEIGRASCRERV